MPADVWAMTLEDVQMITTYWTSHPPVAELVELEIGWKVPTKARVASVSTSEDLDAFAAEVGATCGGE